MVDYSNLINDLDNVQVVVVTEPVKKGRGRPAGSTSEASKVARKQHLENQIKKNNEKIAELAAEAARCKAKIDEYLKELNQ